jgi:hemoglobin/transferrin/lactoferrin receptor protein
MLRRNSSAHALSLSVSTVALLVGAALPLHAQTAQPSQPAQAAAPTTAETLDPITVLATKTEEKAIETLANVSTVRQEQIDQLKPSRTSDLLFGMPSVTFVERGDDPASAINIRGLQDFGRVAVIVDGARQDFQRSGHNANGLFYLEPELLAGVDIVRGPVANIFGSGAIGGVASFRTKDADDILKPGERWGILTNSVIGSNKLNGLGSMFGAVRANPNVDIFMGGTYRSRSDYRDGDGNTVPNTHQDIGTGIAKLTVRPADGHEVKIGGIHYDAQYDSGIPGQTGIYGNHLLTDQGTIQYRFQRPDVPLIDFASSAYWNRTSANQNVKQQLISGGIDFTGPVGTWRNFTINTMGLDVNNTSRFTTGPLKHAVTFGADFFQDDVTITSTGDPGSALTPGGRRDVTGAFAQWKVNYSTWLEAITALRYDTYSLSGGGTAASGDKLSPKFTLGITPIDWFTVYGTYAQGYRAPAVTETLINGYHPGDLFYFRPNPNLQPEVGKTLEAGINIKFDNLLVKGDRLRAKFAAFRNDVTNYIDLTSFVDFTPPFACPPSSIFGGFGALCFQYINVPHARIDGLEFETMYDAGTWFIGLSGQHLHGRNVDTGAPLASIQPDQIATTIGARFLDRKLTVAMRWAAVKAKTLNEIPLDQNQSPPTPVFPATGSFNLVKLYAGYEYAPDSVAALTIDNLLNEKYTPYMNALASPGITVKGSLTVRFSDKTIKG